MPDNFAAVAATIPKRRARRSEAQAPACCSSRPPAPLDPTGQAFAKIKHALRKERPRTRDDLWKNVGAILEKFRPEESATCSANSGYAAVPPKRKTLPGEGCVSRFLVKSVLRFGAVSDFGVPRVVVAACAVQHGLVPGRLPRIREWRVPTLCSASESDAASKTYVGRTSSNGGLAASQPSDQKDMRRTSEGSLCANHDRIPRHPGSTDNRRRRSIKCFTRYWRPHTKALGDRNTVLQSKQKSGTPLKTLAFCVKE